MLCRSLSSEAWGRDEEMASSMPIALAGRCIVAYLATRCHRAESDCASRAAWPATAQPLVYHHSPMALVDMSDEEVPGGVPALPCRGQGCNDL